LKAPPGRSGRLGPGQGQADRTEAGVGAEIRVRHARIDKHGTITVRYRSRLHHVGLGRSLRGTRVVVLVNGLDIRVLTEHGELLRRLTRSDPRHQPTGKTGREPKVSTMS
jgi:hypothetical protein